MEVKLVLFSLWTEKQQRWRQIQSKAWHWEHQRCGSSSGVWGAEAAVGLRRGRVQQVQRDGFHHLRTVPYPKRQDRSFCSWSLQVNPCAKYCEGFNAVGFGVAGLYRHRLWGCRLRGCGTISPKRSGVLGSKSVALGLQFPLAVNFLVIWNCRFWDVGLQFLWICRTVGLQTNVLWGCARYRSRGY